jgi:methionyl aminopeptidase
MHRACTIVVETLEVLAQAAVAGTTTRDLDTLSRERIVKAGAKPAFLGYRGYPATLCISLNNEVVHGIPSGKRKLKDGDIVSLDLGCIVDGFYGDAARTVGVGTISADAQRLLKATEESLHAGIAQCVTTKRVGDIGAAVQGVAEGYGYSVVREFVGHGIGTSLHEDPQVPNFGSPGKGPKLKPGMVLAIEPMVNAGAPGVKMDPDGWTARTEDGSLSAHFEFSVAVTPSGARVLGRDRIS